MRRGLLLVGVLLLGGCGKSGTATATATPVPSSTGKPWVITTQGSATPSAARGGVWTATTSPFPSGFLPLPSNPPAATATPSWQCTPNNGRGTIGGATVVPAGTSAAVTFFNPGGVNLLQFRVTAINEDLVTGAQRDVGWTVVTPGKACEYQTVTITGLTPKTHYVFSVDAVWSQVGGNDGTNAATIARSGVISTT
ncbi:hypothetical protein GCM10010172_68330 [Paractinoplanes ferrugineus]|uniref:Fibronectin type-III domain-containing protein n=1 Tax=Paractinoplanes ferrugineus TaxID=113564 RepID=A0A919J1H5_9ACTN|nr:hypothetical protein [Actinoplanes ferrugineus]GIE12203.1 hypothetical protein Afe05nite_40430 [Actinoplanes ferrugineus]